MKFYACLRPSRVASRFPRLLRKASLAPCMDAFWLCKLCGAGRLRYYRLRPCSPPCCARKPCGARLTAPQSWLSHVVLFDEKSFNGTCLRYLWLKRRSVRRKHREDGSSIGCAARLQRTFSIPFLRSNDCFLIENYLKCPAQYCNLILTHMLLTLI